MQKKGIKIELAIVDDIKKIISVESSNYTTLRYYVNELVKIQRLINEINDKIASEFDLFDEGMLKLQQFEKSMRELGIDPKSNDLYTSALNKLDVNYKLANQLDQTIKGIK